MSKSVLGWMLKLADRARDKRRSQLWSPERALGRRGEDLAHRFLEGAGFRVVARNFTTPTGSGEIDLIARDGETLVFVEVKTREVDEFGAPDRAIDPEKMDRIRRAAYLYARRAGVAWEKVRFDVVAIVMDKTPRITHLRDAFSPRAFSS